MCRQKEGKKVPRRNANGGMNEKNNFPPWSPAPAAQRGVYHNRGESTVLTQLAQIGGLARRLTRLRHIMLPHFRA